VELVGGGVGPVGDQFAGVDEQSLCRDLVDEHGFLFGEQASALAGAGGGQQVGVVDRLSAVAHRGAGGGHAGEAVGAAQQGSGGVGGAMHAAGQLVCLLLGVTRPSSWKGVVFAAASVAFVPVVSTALLKSWRVRSVGVCIAVL
jgi:hypothetical protein